MLFAERAELAIRYSADEARADHSISRSLSCRKVVYKGMLTTEQVWTVLSGFAGRVC